MRTKLREKQRLSMKKQIEEEKKWNKELPAILIQQHKYELKFLGTQTNYVSVYMPVRAAVHIRKTILTHLIFDWILCDVCVWFRVHIYMFKLFFFLSFCGNFSLFCDAKNQMYLFFAVFKKMRHIHRPTNNNKKIPGHFFSLLFATK